MCKNMKGWYLKLFLTTVMMFESAMGCTTFVVGRKATVDGSVMATHSNDGGGSTDPRLVKIPARSFAEGELRPIYLSPENYPRYVGSERLSDIYKPENCQAGEAKCQEFKPIGFIPQVNRTLSYFEATYGTINEKQVSIAESTCSGVYVARSLAEGGSALLSVDQLSQIAMERAHTARQAVVIMGSLAEQYGFYGESASFEGGSESLIVIDPTEAWVFHILADPTGASAIWAAARVPDDSVAVVANMFSIREIDLTDSQNFLGRTDMWELAAAQGLYKDGDSKDFTRTFSDGEYAHKYYSGRRMWGVFRLLAPSANLPATYDNLKNDAPYPFSVPVDNLVLPTDVMAVMRDWYADTEYSTETGLAGGPYGTPDRYSGSTGESQVAGSWERTISIYRSSDSYVVQARPNLPGSVGGIVWYGAGAAHSTVYVPILAGMLASPDCLLWGWQGVYNLTTSYWAHRSVLNLAQTKFSYIIKDIRALQTTLETESLELVSAVSAKYAHSAVLDRASLELITEVFVRNAEKARSAFSELFHTLMFKYADGWVNYWADDAFHVESTGYPAWWLEEVGYPDGPPPISDETAAQKELVAISAERKYAASVAAKVAAAMAVPLQPAKSAPSSPTVVSCPLEGGLKGCMVTCAPLQSAQYRQCTELCLSRC